MGEAVFYFNELLCDIRICEKSSSKEKIIELMLFPCFYSWDLNYIKQIQSFIQIQSLDLLWRFLLCEWRRGVMSSIFLWL